MCIHLARNTIDNRLAQQSNYLLIANTPLFELPPATPLPTFTPTPIPTVKHSPLPAVRLSIPAIDLNTSINEIFPIETVSVNGEKRMEWEILGYAVGHYDTSGNPGEGRNIVLNGHNNTEGEVFRDLNKLKTGDEVILFTLEREFQYKVENVVFVPYLGAEEEGDAVLQSYTAPNSTEMVTLISCWPYATNSHRIVVIAVPTF